MTLAIMQPYFLPYIGYVQLLNAVDTFVLYDDVAFINRGWINRNRLLVNGKDFMFTVPLQDASQNKRICDIALGTDPKWRGKLLQTVQQSYRKAPFYETVGPLTEKIINFPTDNIADYVLNSLVLIRDHLGITTEIVPSSTIYNNEQLKAQDRILDICRQTGATRYINPIGGQVLYNKDTCAQAGVELFFIQSKRVEYPQFGRSEFVPWLSILDVLMFNSPEAIRPMLNEYELV
jgi:hypothetical protein